MEGKKMNFEKGDLITLDEEQEYVVVDVIEYNEKRYTLLITVDKPLKIMLCEIRNINNGQELVEVKDNTVARKVMEKMKA